MRSDLVLSARIESIVWEVLAKNDLYMRLSARNKLATELVALVRDQQAEAWDKGFADGVNHDLGDWGNAPEFISNPYRQETDA